MASDGITSLGIPDMSASSHARWDIFCHVVDNFGDIGVCWRLARQLAGEHGKAVRLWVDDLAAFRHLCPEIRVDRAAQTVEGIEVRHWTGDLSGERAGDVVVETFACRLPEAFEAAMARHEPVPVWVNLEHLSAEPWVAGYHGLPSPHPRLPLKKYFFFPGFTEATGGLLRESDLERQWQEFSASPVAREDFLARLGVPAASLRTGAWLVSLFAYENAALASLLGVWSRGERPILCLVPPGRNRADLERFAGRPLESGKAVRIGPLELHAIPFVPQQDYDCLLWSCDLNFVRGEDSFVRAQWAARPMLWHIYPQREDAHRAKLTAFLDAYLAGLSGPAADAAREFFMAWNGFGRIADEVWRDLAAHFPEWRRHTGKWRKKQMEQQDLCSRLVQFCQSGL
jgi:uncharacterized repeat protein (TIGR03837 family)